MNKSTEPPKRGRPSAFDASLGHSVPGKYSFPAPIWELLKIPLVKYLLNFLALDERFRRKIFEMVLKKMEKQAQKASPKTKPEKAPEPSDNVPL